MSVWGETRGRHVKAPALQRGTLEAQSLNPNLDIWSRDAPDFLFIVAAGMMGHNSSQEGNNAVETKQRTGNELEVLEFVDNTPVCR